MAPTPTSRPDRAICERLVLSPKAETHAGAVVTKLGLLPAINDHRRVLAVIKMPRDRLTNQVRSV